MPDPFRGQHEISQNQAVAVLALLAGADAHDRLRAARFDGHCRKIEHARRAAALRGYRARKIQLGYAESFGNESGLEAVRVKGKSIDVPYCQTGIADRGQDRLTDQLVKGLGTDSPLK